MPGTTPLVAQDDIAITFIARATNRSRTVSQAGTQAQVWITRLNKPWVHILIIVLIQAFAAVFIQTKGTLDVDEAWFVWIQHINAYGLIAGYAAGTDYPPLSFVLLDAVSNTSSLSGLPLLLVLKLYLYVFLLLAGLALYATTRDFKLSVIGYVSLIISSVDMAYLDVFDLVPLIVALWALKKGRNGLGLFLLTVSCMIKFLPLIIVPMLMYYLYRTRQLSLRTVLPSAILMAVLFAIFGWPMLTAFRYALGHYDISALALNFNWILTYAVNFIFGHSLTNVGVVQLPPAAVYPSKLIFFAVYGYIFWKGNWTSFQTFLENACLGYLAYFVFNSGVHENHLITAIVLFMQLAQLNPLRFGRYLNICVFSNINLIYFYGLDGRTSLSTILPFLDLALAFFMVGWFGTMLSEYVAASRPLASDG
jgi:hypothetical protein